ncbi:DUF1707 SHOCT-like domain-containing protein [Saccharopolyspora sp. CA-218241]|uniref:DUF1707 SHOCT-like domain-containing protein n=1 Tax=Saccharopolyspora sp. CA-218241 TaxID=3240027 RepID=UPI003D99CF34
MTDSTRASDRDRERSAERLRVALDEGRLTLTEYDERLRQAYAAVTLGELAPITSDLPAPAPEPPAEPALDEQAKEVAKRKRDKEWREWASVTVVLVGIWLFTSIASGGLNFFWPLIPSGIWALVLVAGMISGEDVAEQRKKLEKKRRKLERKKRRDDAEELPGG